MDIIQTLAQELDKAPQHVENVVRLLDEGNTIPFIARYRKELHGAMDDTSLRTLEERLQYLRGLEERREAVKRSIDEQGKLTDELAAAIDSAKTTSTGPTSKSAALEPLRQRKRGWSRWRRCCSRRSETAPSRRRPPGTTLTRKKG